MKKKKYIKFLNIFACFIFIIFIIALFSTNLMAQFSATLGYNYVNMFSLVTTNFLPYIGLSYNYSSTTTNFYIFNSFFYSLDKFFVNKLNLNFSYNAKNNFINYFIFYVPFNLFLINNNYYPGNFLNTKFEYRSFNKISYNFSLSAEYDKLYNNNIKSPLIFYIDGSLSIPFSDNNYTNELDLMYQTDDSFNFSRAKATFSTKISFFPSINEMIVPKIAIFGGYSYNNTAGNFFGFTIANLFFSAISSKVNFSSEILLSYTNFLSSVLADDIDFSEIKENLLFTIKYSNAFNSSHSLNIRLLYFPQDLTPSILNRAIIEFKNSIFYSSTNIFIIDFLSSLSYTYWFTNQTNNNYKLFFELILKYIPDKNLSILLLNDISTTFNSNNIMSEIYAQIRFMVIYYILKNLSIEGLIAYKSINDKVNILFYEYFFFDLNLTFTF